MDYNDLREQRFQIFKKACKMIDKENYYMASKLFYQLSLECDRLAKCQSEELCARKRGMIQQ